MTQTRTVSNPNNRISVANYDLCMSITKMIHKNVLYFPIISASMLH